MEDYIDIPFGKPYVLTENSLDKIKVSLADAVGCSLNDIKVIFDRKKGYYFYGPYDMCVADLLFEDVEYRGVQIYGGIIEELKIQLTEEQNRIEEEKHIREVTERKERYQQLKKEKRDEKIKYVLQKYVLPGLCFTVGGVTVLTSIGAIREAVTKNPDLSTEIVHRDMNTVASANDLILYAWSNYAMNGIYNVANESKYEHMMTMADNIKEDYFNPTVRSYYNYVEQGTVGLPMEIIGDSIKTNHNIFRNSAYLLNDEIKNRGFGKFSFSNSPYANAIVVDAYGQVVEGSDKSLFGEVYDSKGELITLDSEMGYIIYIRADDVIGNDYGTNNYPEDSIMVKGVPYVNSIYINAFDEPTMGSK